LIQLHLVFKEETKEQGRKEKEKEAQEKENRIESKHINRIHNST